MASELLKRSEVREEDTWKTSDMYENTGAWENELKEISALVDKAAAFEGKAAENCRQSFCCIRDTCQSRRKNRESIQLCRAPF